MISLQNSMQSLMQTLASKEPFYVRCIKPNEVKSPSAFDDKRVEHQIRLVQISFRISIYHAQPKMLACIKHERENLTLVPSRVESGVLF